MRICLVVHGFPPHERTGVENYTASLASALVRAGHRVEVFAPRSAPRLPQLSTRREEVEVSADPRAGEGAGGPTLRYGLTWLSSNHGPRGPEEMLEMPGIAAAFGQFLDRERPEIVHFQHVVKLGVGLIEEAARRGVPAVYTAHDYYPVCHRYTLLRPDLERCDTIGDPEACARCDLALSFLNGIPGLGDYQMGVSSAQIGASEHGALAALLAGDPAPAGVAPEAYREAVRRRSELDERRLEAFRRLDLVIAPTRFLASRLERGGLDAARIRHLPYGIDTRPLRGLSPPRTDGREPLRFGYLGGLSKQKGVELLIAAFRLLQEPAELSIWGHSSDREHVERLRAEAAGAGALWRGPYEPAELPACLEQLDVVVVPSIWVENYPIVIREALAAGRPVITARLGALPESVEDGVDGLLVPPGDPAALAGAMTRCIREEGLVARLAAGIRPVVDIETQVEELAGLYGELRAAAEARAARDLPPHLKSLAARHSELAAMPSAELYGHVLNGLGRLRGLLGGRVAAMGAEQLLEEALGSGTRTKTLLSDQGNERSWLQHTVAAAELARESLSEEVSWLEGVAADRAGALESLGAELRESERGRDALLQERDWLRTTLSDRERELEWLREQVEVRDRALEEGTAEREQLAAEQARLAAEREGLLKRLKQVAAVGMEAMQLQGRVVGAELQRLLAEIRGEGGEEGTGAPLEPTAESLVGAFRLVLDGVRAAQDELQWRRDEMEGARRALERRLAHALLTRTGLGRRVAGWELAEQPPDGRGPASREEAP